MPEEVTQPEATPPEPTPAPAPPVGVTVNKRSIMVDGQLIEMDEKDQIKV
ncbi:MAG: hypothetical protein JNL58_04480 [Planctomyces sp.]|nr:hypothetical protein [Planctomyces sp.]